MRTNASSPASPRTTADRDGDIVEPKGAEFKLPIPLLWQHDSRQPIGQVFYAKVTSAGIEIKARIAKVAEPGTLKDRLDEAWQSIKAGLVKGLSIGFRPSNPRASITPTVPLHEVAVARAQRGHDSRERRRQHSDDQITGRRTARRDRHWPRVLPYARRHGRFAREGAHQ
jgi:phage head maturation protease